MGMFSGWLDNFALRQFRQDRSGRSVFVPFSHRPGYYIEATDEARFKALVKMYGLAAALINVVGSTAALAFTQALVFEEHSSPLKSKIETGLVAYSISAILLYLLPALLLWKVYKGVITGLCSSLTTVGQESVRQIKPSARLFSAVPILILIAIPILIGGLVLLLSRR